MTEKLITNTPLRARAVYIANTPEPLKDRVIWIAGGFVVIAKDENDTAPTWYNSNLIARIEGVELLREPPQTRIEKQLRFF